LDVLKRCDVLGKASIAGTLYDLGDYPGAISKAEKGGRLAGYILRLRDGEMLEELDVYEGDEYLRDEVEVEEDSGKKLRAWAWLLQKKPAGNFRKIEVDKGSGLAAWP
jgi:gamma-glutamylcyclotransferase (GGCT)/AIG2-like uncharacterized protein YtfP